MKRTKRTTDLTILLILQRKWKTGKKAGHVPEQLNSDECNARAVKNMPPQAKWRGEKPEQIFETFHVLQPMKTFLSPGRFLILRDTSD